VGRPQSSKTASSKKSGVKKRSVDTAFLKAFGQHCRKLRERSGYSVDRLSRESENLSSSVIQRLETGSGPVNLSSLRRYSQVLGISLPELFTFEFQEEESPRSFALPLLSAKEIKSSSEPVVPVYSVQAAAGYFGEGDKVESLGHIRPKIKGLSKPEELFVVQAKGHSMLPLIKNGDHLLMRANPGGSRQGKIVLAQYVGPADPDFGGAYTVKVYDSKKEASKSSDSWIHSEVTLKPLNDSYEPIVFRKEKAEGVSILAECLGILQPDLSLKRI
jgi:SOS-response transcriptional repressor LexA